MNINAKKPREWIWELLTLRMKSPYSSLEAFGSTFTGPGWMQESGSRAQIWSRKTQITASQRWHPCLYKRQKPFLSTVLLPGFISSLLGSPPRRYTLNLRPVNWVGDGFIAVSLENTTYHKKKTICLVLTSFTIGQSYTAGDGGLLRKDLMITFFPCNLSGDRQKRWMQKGVKGGERCCYQRMKGCDLWLRPYFSCSGFFFKIWRSMTSDTLYFSLP